MLANKGHHCRVITHIQRQAFSGISRIAQLLCGGANLFCISCCHYDMGTVFGQRHGAAKANAA